MAAAGTVLVTGASSGIGEAAALHLRSRGFDVLAGARREEDLERLRSRGVRAVRLDVTDPASIERAASEARAAAPLTGLVNNAGIAVSAPIEFVPLEELRRQLEVNLVGQVAVIQACLPLLRESRGRIVNISSIGGRVALPMAGPYAASKFALEAVSDSLRREVAPFGIEVCLVEPGGVKTPIWGKGTAAAESLLAGMPGEVERLYGELIAKARERTARISTETGLPPQAVADVIGEALTASRPRTRYLVGRDARLRARIARLLPDRAFDRLVARALRG